MVKFLLEAGSDPNLFCSEASTTPLLLALKLIDRGLNAREIVDLLIGKGADPNLKHESTHSPLEEAL